VRDHGVARKVTFLEDVDAETLRALYRHAGIVALSSDEEGLGLVLLEAMASGVPVVSTDCGGPSTVVDDGVTGLLTPVGDADAFADALETLVEDPGRARRMGRAGRERAVNEFSLDAAGGRFLEIYRELVGE
jgi:mannosyltransferase